MPESIAIPVVARRGSRPFGLYFPNYDSLLKYCKKRFKRWDRGWVA